VGYLTLRDRFALSLIDQCHEAWELKKGFPNDNGLEETL
jgi:hypothetical protein